MLCMVPSSSKSVYYDNKQNEKSLATNKIGIHFHFDGQKVYKFPQSFFQNSSINSFNKYVLGTHDVPSSLLDTVETMLKKDKVPALLDLTICCSMRGIGSGRDN